MKIFNIITFALGIFSPIVDCVPVTHNSKNHVVHNHQNQHPWQQHQQHPWQQHHTSKHTRCSVSYIQAQDKIVKEKCCSGKVCNTAPKICSKECAVVFMPFYKKCRHFFDHSFYNVHYSTSPTNKRKLQQRPTHPKYPTHQGHSKYPTHQGHSKYPKYPTHHHKHIHIPKR